MFLNSRIKLIPTLRAAAPRPLPAQPLTRASLVPCSSAPRVTPGREATAPGRGLWAAGQSEAPGEGQGYGDPAGSLTRCGIPSPRRAARAEAVRMRGSSSRAPPPPRCHLDRARLRTHHPPFARPRQRLPWGWGGARVLRQLSALNRPERCGAERPEQLSLPRCKPPRKPCGAQGARGPCWPPPTARCNCVLDARVTLSGVICTCKEITTG